jgi:hypothetical protein
VAELARPGSDVARAAEDAGLQPEALGAAVDVREAEQGLEPLVTTVVVSVASSLGAKVAETLWT